MNLHHPQSPLPARLLGSVLILVICLLPGCHSDDETGAATTGGDSHIALSLKASTSSINEDEIFWEDRVDEVRMLVFDSETGEAVYNEKLYFPNGFSEYCKAVRLRPGTYDFYFIANETVYPGDFSNALMEVAQQSDFSTDSRFTQIPYQVSFFPDGTTQEGRFLMSAVYTGITLVSGGSETSPLVLPLPTSKVELIRSLAKVEVIFRKKTAGSSIPDGTITEVQLEQVASWLSVPPYDNYYTGPTTSSQTGSLTGLDYSRDSIGSVLFYIPEFLIPQGATNYTELSINNQIYPIQTDEDRTGITEQRRTVPEVSDYSVIRNYHYQINTYLTSEGGIEIRVYVQPWRSDAYQYFFEGDAEIVIPPVIPTDSSIIMPTDCGKIEIISVNEHLSSGLQGAYNDVVNYYDPEIQGPTIYKGEPPYHCEKKYGEGWRLMNSCELMSFLATLDAAYNVWMCNTWDTYSYNQENPDRALPFFSVALRREAQALLENLTGEDLSGTVFQESNNWQDVIPNKKLDIIDQFFTPGDILVRPLDGNWPFAQPPNQEDWFYYESTIQVKAFWYSSGYVDISDRSIWQSVLYANYHRYDYGSTVSRCVRAVE